MTLENNFTIEESDEWRPVVDPDINEKATLYRQVFTEAMENAGVEVIGVPELETESPPEA